MRILLSIILSAIILSCDDSFSPKGDFDEKYVLNCIVRGDSLMQYAIVAKSYDSNSLDPYDNTMNTSLNNARVTLTHMNNTYIMKDSTSSQVNVKRTDEATKFYYIEKLLINDEQKMRIDVTFENGEHISAETTTPKFFVFDSDKSTRHVDFGEIDAVIVGWKIYEPNLLFSPKLVIFYNIEGDDLSTRRQYEVPVDYSYINNRKTPIYPIPSSNQNFAIPLDYLTQAMQDLSAGIANKKLVTISGLQFQLRVFDTNLSRYYSLTNTENNIFVARDNRSDYSNVEGGIGIFGSYLYKTYRITLDEDFVQYFGYKFKP